MENLEELKKLAKAINPENILTKDEIEQVLQGILKILSTFKKETQNLNENTKKTFEDFYSKVLKQHDTLISQIDNNKEIIKDEILKELTENLSEIKSLMDEAMAMKPENGKDADEEKIIAEVLSKVEIPTTIKLIDDINNFQGDDYKIDYTRIKNVPDISLGYTEEVKTLQNRTQLLLQIATQRADSTTRATTALDNLASVAINTSLLLGTSDGGALGSTTKMWSDLFLASGAVINWNNGDVTLTHAADTLTFAGGTIVMGPLLKINAPTGNPEFDFQENGTTRAKTYYDVTTNQLVFQNNESNALGAMRFSDSAVFDLAVCPSTDNGAPLGDLTLQWSDLFLASGAVINFNNGDVTLTHSTNTITIGGGQQTFAATTTSYASFNLPTGTAPTAPVDGDVWREDNTNTGLKIRINGVTKTISVA